MRRIKTENNETFAHVLGKGTIEIKRQNQRFIITGDNFQIIGTEPTQTRKMVVAVEGGRLIEDDIIVEDTAISEEQQKILDAQKEKAAEVDTTDIEDAALSEDKKNKDENKEEGEENGEGEA